MPTVFSLLNFSYDSYFYGNNILSPDFKERAFVATYQNLGYLENNILTVLSPVKNIKQFRFTRNKTYEFEMKQIDNLDSMLINKAIANYQTSSINSTMKIKNNTKIKNISLNNSDSIYRKKD